MKSLSLLSAYLQVWSLTTSSAQSTQSISSNTTNPIVDLGYAKYQGITNSTTNISSFRGIRYAAPPIGALRYQAPQPPPSSDSSTPINATSFQGFPVCAQAGVNPLPANAGSEDCLFLSVAGPADAQNLPVLIWIHGGGFEYGNGKLEFTEMMVQSNNSFVAVSIQYRLNSFGFLSSADVKRRGVLNAGLLDQEAAIKWVHEYIYLFGGDKESVTIGGESAGASSVYYHTIARDGTVGTTLWNGAIFSSSASLKPYHYSAGEVNRPYYRLAEAVGCLKNHTMFQCLVDAPFDALQAASNNISLSEIYEIPPYTPVVDGEYITTSPSELLLEGKTNGKYALIGNQANEGFDFVPIPEVKSPLFPLSINSSANLATYIKYFFPLFSDTNAEKIMAAYPPSLAENFANHDQEEFNIYQELANNIVGEAVFYCPAAWIAQTMEKSWRYQFSITPALHAGDLSTYLPSYVSSHGPGQDVTPDFRQAFLAGWINFITKYDPSNQYLGSNVSENGTWPVYNNFQTPMVNFNTSGGELQDTYSLNGFNITQAVGGTNDFSIIDETSWQGGRGARCDLWRSLGGLVPS